MDATTIISTIDQIHERFENPPILRQHQKRVAAVCAFIADHWHGPAIDKDNLIAAALVHDMGNITKADFDDEKTQRPLMGEQEWARIDYWRDVQRRVFERYGREHHAATHAMLDELGVDDAIRTTADFTGFHNSERAAAEGTWEGRILTYADVRCSPTGVVSMRDRFAEGFIRYQKRDTEGLLSADGDFYREQFALVERMVGEHLDVPVSAITDASVEQYFASL